ncbi:zinc finger CCCH domain-containing protein 3 [Polymixia lowei]
MEEREALKRQIELLQNLINNHKSVHGNTPSARVDQLHPARPISTRGSGQSASNVRPHSSRGRPYAPHSHGNWRKTYSLSNKNSQSSLRQPSPSTTTSVPLSSSPKAAGTSDSILLPGHSKKNPAREETSGPKTATVSSGIASREEGGHRSAITGVRTAVADSVSTDTKIGKGVPEASHQEGNEGSGLKGAGVPQQEPLRQTGDFQQRAGGKDMILPGRKGSGSSQVLSSVNTSTSARVDSSTQLHIKPCLPEKTSSETKLTVSMATPTNLTAGNSTPPFSALSSVSQQIPFSSRSQPSPACVTASPLKQSKFTWVKSQDTGGVGPKQTRSMSPGKGMSSATTSISNAGIASGGPPTTTIKRTPSKKLPRRLSLVTGAPKTSKYTWISSTAGGQAKLSRKPLSPKALALAQRALGKVEATKKLKSAATHSPKTKKGMTASSTTSSPSSRYRWKAGGQSACGTAAGAVSVARRGSVFHWTSEKNSKGAPPSLPVCGSVQTSSSPSGFKLRSRMKIIRRSACSGSVSERRTSPPAGMVSSRHSPRGRTHIMARSPANVRKIPSKELVSFGRHKLRRLSPTSCRTGPASPSHRGPAPQRVFKSRYKMVTRLGATHTSHYSPTLSWRAKRIQSARSVLQSRLRAPQDRHLPSQHWRGRGMRWIGGSLYRVSANKLSRTVATSTSINRTGRWVSPLQVSPNTSPLVRPSNSRHVASRAVQRSLAIIRHARLKKQQRQYCMYFNRFGKCNRGASCPYIHDPDKVAVCTRFLRGTCKQADGTCPFSHKVAKEKMPVCSYFLKGICNNSSCPYSHVYVSRKAAVCQDFIKGYCPQGEKCKKKHTLVCPDFSRTGSCPQGSRCKLQHRQKAKGSGPAAPAASAAPAKRARAKDSAKRPRLSVIMPPWQAQGSQADQGTPTSGPLMLPSFISLSSSPEEAEVPDTPPAAASQVKEKKLQIKPRL